jgi:hypothetical protein
VLGEAARHFHKLARLRFGALQTAEANLPPPTYADAAFRRLFLSSVFALFCPAPPPPARLLAPAALRAGRLPVGARAGLTLRVLSGAAMEVVAADARAWPAVAYDERGAIAGAVLTVVCEETQAPVRLDLGSPRVANLARKAISAGPAPRRLVDAAVDSCLAFADDSALNAGFAESLATLLSSLDVSFVLACYALFAGEGKADFRPVFHALTTLFACKGRSLQLIKLLAYQDLAAVKNPDQIFRGDSPFFQSVKIYLERVAGRYRNAICQKITALVKKAGSCNYDAATDKDAEIAVTVIKQVFTLLIDELNSIPPIVRSLCRFLRLVVEGLFANRAIFYRPIGSLIIFRFLVSEITIPSTLKADTPPDRQLLKFGTLLTRAATFTVTGGDLSATANRPIVENSGLIAQFYDKLCTDGGRAVDLTVDRKEIVEAAAVVRDFVVKNADRIRAFRGGATCRHIYVQELLSEFIIASR